MAKLHPELETDADFESELHNHRAVVEGNVELGWTLVYREGGKLNGTPMQRELVSTDYSGALSESWEFISNHYAD